MFKNILVPCDISYQTNGWLKPTIETVCDFAEKYGSTLTFLTVVPDNLLKGFYPDVYEPEIVEDAMTRLGDLVKDYAVHPDQTRILVREGGICSEIIRAAKELPADLVAMASHGPIMSDYLLGSNASHVALHVPCSVMIIRQPPKEKR